MQAKSGIVPHVFTWRDTKSNSGCCAVADVDNCMGYGVRCEDESRTFDFLQPEACDQNESMFVVCFSVHTKICIYREIHTYVYACMFILFCFTLYGDSPSCMYGYMKICMVM